MSLDRKKLIENLQDKSQRYNSLDGVRTNYESGVCVINESRRKSSEERYIGEREFRVSKFKIETGEEI